MGGTAGGGCGPREGIVRLVEVEIQSRLIKGSGSSCGQGVV